MNQTNSKIFKKENFNKIFSVASLIILMVFFTVVNSSFFSAYNIKNILTDMSPLLLMACGVSFILFLGSIDLSIGSIASCAAVMLTFLLDKIGPMAYAVVILYGLAAGLLNGILHTKLKVPSFIATLSTQSIWQSAAYLISGGMPMVMVPAVWPYINWAKAGIGFVPLLFLAAVVVLLACYVLQKRMALGRTMLALGTNERAARLIGLEVVKAKIVAFTISGLTAALGGRRTVYADGHCVLRPWRNHAHRRKRKCASDYSRCWSDYSNPEWHERNCSGWFLAEDCIWTAGNHCHLYEHR